MAHPKNNPVYKHNPPQPDKPHPNGGSRQTGQLWQPVFEEGRDPEALTRIWAERAYALAETPPAEVVGDTLDVLVFLLGTERYGLNVECVREIYPLEQLTRVPRTPDFVAGVFSARGRILSVVDLRAFLGLAKVGLSDHTKIIVVSCAGVASEVDRMEVGFLADEVADVVTIFKTDIEPPLATHAGAHTEYIQGITADSLVVFDLNALLADKRLIVHEDIL